MSNFVRKAVMFNLDDAHQRKLFDWCESSSSNFSGFVKGVLFAQMMGSSKKEVPVAATPRMDDESIGDIF